MFTMPGNGNWGKSGSSPEFYSVSKTNSSPSQKSDAFSSLFHLSSGVIGEQKSCLIFGRCFFYSKREKDSWSPKMRILPNPNFPAPPRNGELPKKLKLLNVPRWSGGGFLFAGGLLWDTCFFGCFNHGFSWNVFMFMWIYTHIWSLSPQLPIYRGPVTPYMTICNPANDPPDGTINLCTIFQKRIDSSTLTRSYHHPKTWSKGPSFLPLPKPRGHPKKTGFDDVFWKNPPTLTG